MDQTLPDILMWGIYLCSLYLSSFWLLVLAENRGMIKKTEGKQQGILPNVSIIVPAYNEERIVAESVRSLQNLDYPADKIEIIVVNDGSTDKTKEICEKIRGIRFINLEKNSGTKAIPLNRGITEAHGEVIACLDADSMVDRHALRRMICFFQDPRVGAVTPSLKVHDPKNMIQKLQWFEYIFAVFLRKLMSFLDCIYVTPGPFTLYRREALECVGGFDEKNITEDMEMAMKLQKNNYRIENAVDADVYTLAPDSVGSLYRQRRRWYRGLIHNSIKYRRLFFNAEYGDFGMLMPLHILSAVVLVLSTLLFVYFLFSPIATELSNLALIGFDVTTYLRNAPWNLSILDLDYPKLIVTSFILLLGAASFIAGHEFSGEKITKYGISAVLAYMLFYFVLLGFIWLGLLAEFAAGAKRRW
jgi:cellulose synthase/poly-beta-1,6-N-acetylglucosamine synthase-like glycosyltransferase